MAEELSSKYNDLHIQTLALATEGQVLAQMGEFDRSQHAIERARHVSGLLGSPLIESDVDLFAAQACLAMGNWEQALEFGQRCVERAIATDNMDCICSGMVCIGYTHLELGRIPEAASAFEKGIERSDISGAVIPKLMGQAGLAMTRFMRGNLAAIEDLEKVVENMRLSENHVGAASANLMLGTCLIQLGELERSSDYLHQAVDFYRRSQMYPFLAKALRAMAELMERQARPAEAQEYRTEAESLRSSTP
jgi:tetratricopeptide (TPR) repeat protein